MKKPHETTFVPNYTNPKKSVKRMENTFYPLINKPVPVDWLTISGLMNYAFGFDTLRAMDYFHFMFAEPTKPLPAVVIPTVRTTDWEWAFSDVIFRAANMHGWSFSVFGRPRKWLDLLYESCMISINDYGLDANQRQQINRLVLSATQRDRFVESPWPKSRPGGHVNCAKIFIHVNPGVEKHYRKLNDENGRYWITQPVGMEPFAKYQWEHEIPGFVYAALNHRPTSDITL